MTKYILLSVVLATLPVFSNAQGCSDAGVCTAGPIGELYLNSDTSSQADPPRHYARLVFSYAVGEQRTTVLQGIVELGFGIGERFQVALRLPYQRADGDLGDHAASGDPLLTANFAALKGDRSRLDLLLGFKFPANIANAAVTGRPLPMPYQSSLGTTDLLLGANYRYHRWNTALAFQLPLQQNNENQFTHPAWGNDPRALGYFESAFLERAPDAVIRLQYAIPINRLAVQPGLLAIQHLGQDTRLEAEPDPIGMPVMPDRVTVDGSEGLTLNLTLDAAYRLTDKWTLELAYGSPLITREVRPDGLTRSLVLNMGATWRFGP